jgi:phosphoesterase RecJ-like protein
VAVAGSVFNSSSLGRLRLFGAVLNRMQIDDTGRLVTVSIDQQLATDCGASDEDADGLINLPLTAKDVQAVVFFKEAGPNDWRVSLRSKGSVNINAVAKEFGGGGHKNASGCSAAGRLEDLKDIFRQKITRQLDEAVGSG